MKKPYLILSLLICLGILSACKKDAPDFVKPGEFPLGTTIGGGNSGGGAAASNSYQPVTVGSYWKFVNTIGNTTDNSTVTVSGKTQIFNNKTYYEAIQESQSFGTQTGYWYNSNNTYAQRSNTYVNNVTVDLTYLKDNLAVGETWTATISDDGKINGVPARVIGKILEKGISHNVNNKTYNEVIHTSVDLQYDLFSEGKFNTVLTYEFYAAKGVGLIETKALSGEVVVSTIKLIDYKIK